MVDPRLGEVSPAFYAYQQTANGLLKEEEEKGKVPSIVRPPIFPSALSGIDQSIGKQGKNGGIEVKKNEKRSD